MEGRLGHDFGHARIHTDRQSAESAAVVGANAYTVGSHVMFARSAYQPTTLGGRWLLAHELAHVAQQTTAWQQGVTGGPSLSPSGLRVARSGVSGGTFRAQPADMSRLEQLMIDLFKLLDDSTRSTVTGNKTIAIGLVRGEDGTIMTVYTVSQNWTNANLRAAADQVGITRWEALPAAEGRSTAGAPGDAEQLLIGAADANDAQVGGAAVSRPVCPDCGLAIRYYESGPFPVVEVKIPAPVAAAAGTAGAGAGAPTDFDLNVRTQYRVLSTEEIPGGRVASEIEVTFGDNLDQVNAAIQAKGGQPLPESMVIRVTTDSAGEFVAAESATGEAGGLVEVLARQALASVPEAVEGATGGAAGAVSPWVRGLGWAGLVAFAGITAYRYSQASEAEKPRVLVKAAGGFAGGMVGGYVVCNLVLGIETLGWSLLICGALVGIPAGMAGEAIANVAYEEATIDDDEIRAWVASHDDPTIGALTVEEKLRMIFSLMKGWISDDDVNAMVRILKSVGTVAEMNRVRRILEPMVASEMTSIGQRTQVRLALSRLQ